MASLGSLANVEKLTENNYELWKVHIKSVLVFSDLWQYVDGTEAKPRENAQEWLKKDAKALALINLSVSQSQLNHVKKADSSKEAWDKLVAIYESRGPVRKAGLYKELLRMTKPSDMTMTQYVNDFEHKAEQLEVAGIKLPDDLLSIMLLASLPTQYENFSVAIESRDEVPTLEYLKTKLKEEEARQNDRDAKVYRDSDEKKTEAFVMKYANRNKQSYSNYKDKSVKSNNWKFNGNCFKCGKAGHKSRYCRSKANRVDSTDAMTAVTCNAEISKSHTWCLDSGATKHMCNSREKFNSFTGDMTTNVYTAADQCVKSHGEGTIKISARIDKYRTNPVELKDVMYVPELRNNLLSVSAITDRGYVVNFGQNEASVKRADGSTALTANKSGQLYIVNQNNDRAMHTNSEKDNLVRWHQRLGHLNLSDLKKLKSREMVEGLNLQSTVSDIECEICKTGKICQQPYKQSTNRYSEKLGLVHSDICGPMRTESLGGAKYFATFIDDCTRYTETVMLRQKSDVFEAFQKYKRRVEKETGCVIKRLRTDNGREYLSKDFEKLLEEEGITRQLSVEYTPQQNGVAERANRTLIEMARCVMVQANLPQSLWGEAVCAATYIRNRCPTKILNDKTPLEAWSNRKPYVGFMRIIGSKAIALNKREKRGKFEPRGDVYVLVGYDNTSKAYRLWKRGTKTVIKARDVKFIERTESDEKSSNNISAPTVKFHDNSEEQFDSKEQSEETISERSENSDAEIDEKSSEITATPRREPEIPRRGRGRPKTIRTGKVGKPRKIYQTAKESADPTTVEEAMNREDSEL